MSDEAVEPAVRRVPDDANSDDVTTPTVEELTGDERRLHPRIRWVWALNGAIGAVVIGAIIGVASFVLRELLWPGPVAFTVLLVVGLGFALARYRAWRYRVRADSLLLDRGVVTRVRTVVPYVRIQHVDSRRGPVERLLGLASVVVYTAGSRGADVTIPGLTPEGADDLQRRLKQLAIAAEGEDAV